MQIDDLIYPYIILSLVIFIAIHLWHTKIYYKFLFLFLFLFILFLDVFYLISDYFTGHGIDESVFFHLFYGLDINTLFQFKADIFNLVYVTLFLFIWCIFYIKIFIYGRKNNKSLGSNGFNQSISLIFLCVLFFVGFTHPTTKAIALYNIMLGEKQRYKELEREIKPVKVNGNMDFDKKNFIYLYLESVERTFLDKNRYPNLMPKLANIEAESITIKGIKQAPMTSWTIAGMTSSQCGIPLATYTKDRNKENPKLRNNDLDGLKDFLSGAICVGDILNDSGYSLSYIGGADLSFAGKGNFYKSHGFEEVYGLNDFQREYGENIPLSKWGVYDDLLYIKLLDLLEKKAKQGKPFGIYALTLDTHAPLGHKTPKCRNLKYKNGSSEILNSVHCADYLLGDFIKKFRESPYSKNTILVISSDHFMMMNDAGLDSSDTSRENLWLVYNSKSPSTTIYRNATTLDIPPTFLSILGYKVDDFVLGRNLFGKQETLYEKMGEENFYKSLQAWRMNMWSYWNKNSNKF